MSDQNERSVASAGSVAGDRDIVERLNRCQAENARLREEAAAMTAAIQQVKALIEKGQKRHYDCEDSWYACPLSEGGCTNPAWDKTDCTCGASQYNEILDAVASTIRTWQ